MKILETLGLYTLLASGCAHMNDTTKDTSTNQQSPSIAESKEAASKGPDINKEKQGITHRVIEEVAERIKACGDFTMIMNGVVMTNDDVSDFNTDAMILRGVKADRPTMECIVEASMSKDLPKMCIPVGRSEDKTRGTIDMTIDCRNQWPQ